MIYDAQSFRVVLAAGPYSRVGSYPLFFINSAGDTICWRAAFENRIAVMRTLDKGGTQDFWHLTHVQVNWESKDLVCAYTGDHIEAAYTVVPEPVASLGDAAYAFCAWKSAVKRVGLV